jgi:hypothetical protein
MADFQEQVMGITGLTIDGSSTAPSRSEFSTFLNDGVIDVTNRWLLVKPQDAELFVRESITTAANGLDIGGAEVISVLREAGADGDTDGSTAWRQCRKIPASMQSRVVDTESLNFASKYNPVYAIDNNGVINVYPTPDGTDDGFRAYYVNNAPEETDGTALDHASTGIKYFPKDKVYLVAIYASIRSLQSAMGALHENTGISTALGAITTELNRCDEIIEVAKDKVTAYYTSIADIEHTNELWDSTVKRFTVVRDALVKAQSLIDEGTMAGDTEPESAQYWLADEDPEMVQATLQTAQTEIQRANTAVAEINSLLASYNAELGGVQPYLSTVQTTLAQADGYAKEAQTRAGNLQQEYTWYDGRLKDLKEEYDRAFIMAAPKQQANA